MMRLPPEQELGFLLTVAAVIGVFILYVERRKRGERK